MTVRMVEERIRLASAPDGHDQRVSHELGGIVAFIDQPTTRRENRSMTAAT